MSTLTSAIVEDVQTPAPTEDVQEPVSSDWKEALPEDIKDDPALKAIQNVDGLAKSYVHSQRMLGTDKLIIPNKYAENHEWKSFFHKAGLPQEVKDYEIKPNSEEVDKTFLDDYKKASHEANILPGQAQKMFDWYMGKASGEIKRQEEEEQQHLDKGISSLKNNWGNAYDSKVKAAQVAINHFGDDALRKRLEDTGFGNDAELIRVFSKIGETLTDDNFKGDSNPGSFGKTPEQAQAEINDIMANPKHPYFDKNHPGHKKSLEDMQRLFTYKG
jgi:hypothetical protein